MLSPQHILLVTRSLPFHRLGGMEIVAWDLARQFVREGHQVTVLTTEIQGKPPCFQQEGVDIVALHGTKSGCYSRQWWRGSRAYFEEHLASSVSMVLSVSAAGFKLLQFKSRLSIPFIMQAHGTSWGELKSKWRTWSLTAILSSLRNVYGLAKDLYYYPKFDRIVAVGNAVYQQLQTFPVSMALPKKNIRLINNGIDSRVFYPDESVRKNLRSQLGIGLKTHVVLSASRLHRQKGVQYGLKGFEEYLRQYKDACYLIVGDGPERKDLERQANILCLGDHVRFFGAKPREELNQYMAAADVVLFTTTREEGLPLNVLEALSAGVPVIMSRHLQKTVQIDRGVFVVDPQDSQGIATALKQVLNEQDFATRATLLPPQFHLSHAASLYFAEFAHVRL